MITWDALNALAVSRHTRPIGPDGSCDHFITIAIGHRIPAPHINTLLSTNTAALLQAHTAINNGSSSVTWLYDMLLGNLHKMTSHDIII